MPAPSDPTSPGSVGGPPSPTSPFGPHLSNLASRALGARVLFATDEWFAAADHLIDDSDPLFVPDLYCEQGKVMDGWESRRRREAGNDWCVVRLAGAGGEVRGLEVDTAHFTGNQAPRISVEAASVRLPDGAWVPGAARRLARGGGSRGTGRSPESVRRAEEVCRSIAEWTEILPATPLRPGYEETRLHRFLVTEEARRGAGLVTHLRVNYYPDGGVARLRAWGLPAAGGFPPPTPESRSAEAAPDDADADTEDGVITLPEGTRPWSPHYSSRPYPHPELSSSALGGLGLECSNRHYGVPSNLIQTNYGKDMGDGWETARHPDRPAVLMKDPETGLVESPLMDWAVLKLGKVAHKGVSRIIVDTRHFRGNYPESFMVEGCHAVGVTDEVVCASAPHCTDPRVEWFELVPRTRAGPDAEHGFLRPDVEVGEEEEVAASGSITNSSRPVSHIRVRIYPDGGLSRVRVYGEAEDEVGVGAGAEIRSHL